MLRDDQILKFPKKIENPTSLSITRMTNQRDKK